MKTELSQEVLPHKAFIDITDIPKITHISTIRCGSYTTEWIARAVGLHPIPSNVLLPGPVWLDRFRPIPPSKMMKFFRFRGMESEEVDVSNLSDDEKLRWVKEQVAKRRWPPALLIKTRVLHWIAVGGYDDERQIIYFYDSRFGLTSIDPYLPIGNNTMSYEELLQRWKGRLWMKHKAIVITKKLI